MDDAAEDATVADRETERRGIMWELRDVLEDGLAPDFARNVAVILTQDAKRQKVIDLLNRWERTYLTTPDARQRWRVR